MCILTSMRIAIEATDNIKHVNQLIATQPKLKRLVLYIF